MVYGAASENKLPLVLGGDHSVAVGTVSGLSRCYREKNGKIGLIWIDAHADINTPATSPSGNVHGMPVACIVGIGPEEMSNIYGYSPKVDPQNVALVGLRDVDRTEAPQVRGTGVTAYTMRSIDERGLRAVIGDRYRFQRHLRISRLVRHGCRRSR
jgi:arginase